MNLFLRQRKTLELLLLLSSGLIFACTPQKSSIKVQGGEFIGANSLNIAPPVIQINADDPARNFVSNCSGTVVSSNTVLTAAHCIKQGLVHSIHREGRFPIKATATKLIPHEGFILEDVITGDGGPGMAAREDIALIVFPEGSFSYYAELSREQIQVGQQTVLVGYSKYEGSEDRVVTENNNSKRWGYSKVVSVFDKVLHGIYDNIGLHKGDSGGPLLINCSIAGVTSHLNHKDIGQNFYHANVTHPENLQWLKDKSADGAYICGLHGEDAKFCPAGGKLVVDTTPGKSIPCKLENNSLKDDGASLVKPQLDEVYLEVVQSSAGIHLNFSHTQHATPLNTYFCFGASEQACTQNQISYVLNGKVGNRNIYNTDVIRQLSSQKTAQFIIKSSTGTVLRKFAVERQ